ncbi:MAG: precorrin-3B C(17)-methyltransferase [Aestuariivirga sp.]|uniref:precorrin-3B C(17)-methyltransferase n=1 Tax=Aestuariivirga sp. TaxID=2650926 RepID=UPI0038CF6B96
MMKPVLFVLGASALPLAVKLKEPLGAEIHTPACVAGGDHRYAKATQHLGFLFQEGRAIIGLCAAGILIRALSPHLKDKRAEPPVIALAEDGSTAVPLLGGHHGANALARRIAALTGGHAAVTTASEVRFGLALDDPAPGFSLANPRHMKAATAALLNGAALALDGGPSPFPQADIAAGREGFDGVTLKVTSHDVDGSERLLVYHPRSLILGLGCERHTEPAELIGLADKVMADHSLAPAALAAVASLDLKEDEAAVHAVARHFGVPARFFTAAELANETPRLRNPSGIVAREVGVAGVAEAAALAAAGPESILIAEKTRSARGTCAIAMAPEPILSLPGRAQGRLDVVGIGPGADIWRTPEAVACLTEAEDWVGYGLYLDLVADLRNGQREHRFPLGAEEDRVRHAIALAAQGHHVALICSGDAGIYAMAALVHEVLALEPSRIAVSVMPGISAFQAAAARAGAMIGHDFCCISLSDLLTPWEAIVRRVRAAAEADFVTAFYNPRSLKRRGQLDEALAILRAHRPAATPVVIASNLGRPEEKVTILPLAEVDAAAIDMLTLVMVGSSQSSAYRRGDGRTYAYTPRGYAKKREAAE